MSECPTCGKVLNTLRGMRQHHTKVHDESLPNRTCEGCGEDFYDPRADRVYCDHCYTEEGEANGNWRDAKETATCQLCQTEFEYYPSDKGGVYCSSCVSEANEFLGTPSYELRDIKRVVKPCEECGKRMELLKSLIDYGFGKYCSIDCRNEAFSAEYDDPHEAPYRGDWRPLRRQALARDGHQCLNCGRDKSDMEREPDVHHIIPVRAFKDPQDAHYLENLISLCKCCHRKAEIGDISPQTLREMLE